MITKPFRSTPTLEKQKRCMTALCVTSCDERLISPLYQWSELVSLLCRPETLKILKYFLLWYQLKLYVKINICITFIINILNIDKKSVNCPYNIFFYLVFFSFLSKHFFLSRCFLSQPFYQIKYYLTFNIFYYHKKILIIMLHKRYQCEICIIFCIKNWFV